MRGKEREKELIRIRGRGRKFMQAEYSEDRLKGGKRAEVMIVLVVPDWFRVYRLFSAC